MNTPKTEDKLKNMFSEIKTENLSSNFMDNLMLRVEKEVVAQNKKKYFLNYLLIASGVAGIFLIPALIIYFTDIEISSIQFPNVLAGLQSIFKNFSIDPRIAGLGLIILLLLLGDLILRKFSAHKKESM